MGDTIRSNGGESGDAATLALLALGWLLSDADRASRLLALTGMTADGLRKGADNPRMLAEIIRYLEGCERDLVAAAESVGTTPASLVNARIELERQS
ncbi:uncharacterized protein DUF3572 [Blastomonas natatoria]|uniref:Uncharacterized protein DUF3572 n=1 Tax=Blastomonas natatoria TaxID=34015 RepID=A0A2V3VBK0_9SPHN|nr:DUF3572 family protein [Blastomonas natatoria]PXW79077.1 uncharacterized protein DUF3572 [Blastomonas natatoria]